MFTDEWENFPTEWEIFPVEPESSITDEVLSRLELQSVDFQLK